MTSRSRAFSSQRRRHCERQNSPLPRAIWGDCAKARPESIESSSLHLDVLRDLKRIHSHICSVAYPVLEHAGAPEPNRLRIVEPDERPIEDKDAASAG